MKTLFMATAMLLCGVVLHAQHFGLFTDDIRISVQNATEMNSEDSEFGVIEWKGKYCFTTNRNHFNSKNEFLGDGAYNLVTYDEHRNYRKVYPFESVPDRNNVGSVSQVSNGTFYFTAENKKADYNLREATRSNAMAIYAAEQKDGHWKYHSIKITKNKKYSFVHPTISNNGRTMYFASDMPGGYGGMDLYVIHKVENGWSEPKNLGAGINTEMNELFPFLHQTGILFFSSDGHKGFGGMDIYAVVKEEGNWTSPENMGSPVNTTANDFSVFMNKDLSNGFFSSDREGGLGGDDIYNLTIQNELAKADDNRMELLQFDGTNSGYSDQADLTQPIAVK